VVYAALLLPLPPLGLRQALARWGLGGGDGVAALWSRHAGPLSTERAALLLHAAAAALALGLVSGLYLRGLVLDYRAGWQSTFLSADQVQALLGALLAPASALTGTAMPAVAPLRVGPGGDAQASAAPWIHLYAATLALWVVLPRALLAWRAGWRAQGQARRFPLRLDSAYFEALHPLMRPGLPRAVRLLWANELPRPVTLLGQAVATPDGPLTLLRSEEGDELELLLPPAGLQAALAAEASASWWARWRAARSPAGQALQRLREQADAVLLLAAPDTPRPPWLAALGKPVLVLVDAPSAEPPALPLQALADGWLPDGRLLAALAALLEGDPRMPRLAASWRAHQQARFDAATAEIAASLARVASAREAVAEEGLLAPRRGDADNARNALVAGLDAELQAHAARLAALLGLPPPDGDAPGVPAAAAALRSRVGEGRAALVGGVLSGALAGLKADLLTGGLTMGAGALAGGVIGALGAAGAARGLNVVRGTDRSYAVWDEAALAPVTEALLLRYLVLAHGLEAGAAQQRLAPALQARQAALAELWRGREKRPALPGETEALARALQPLLAAVLRQALGGP
jgi:hypothetical protein